MTDSLRSASTPNLLADFRAYCLAHDRAEADAEARARLRGDRPSDVPFHGKGPQTPASGQPAPARGIVEDTP